MLHNQLVVQCVISMGTVLLKLGLNALLSRVLEQEQQMVVTK